MSIRLQRGLTAAQKTELWERWRRGESQTDIGLALGKTWGSVAYVLKQRGGIYQPPPCRSPGCLSLSEREAISRGLVSGCSLRAVARQLHRAPSTISREVQRNGGLAHYRAADADAATWRRAARPKPCKLVQQPELGRIVADKLRRFWSPQQIAGWLKRQYPQDESMQVSHETIYRSLFVQGRGVLKRELMQHLRSRRVMRRAKASTNKGRGQGQIVDAISIRERPAEVEDRAVPGHWEGDLLAGSRQSHVATLVERHSRYVMLAKLPNRNSQTVVTALTELICRLPVELRKSLTWDRGAEMAQHKQISLATDLQIYFCDPHSPWQRGSNENTNRLLRQYLPKGTDLSVYSQAELDAIARELNERPRQTLGFMTPAEKLQQTVAPTD